MFKISVSNDILLRSLGLGGGYYVLASILFLSVFAAWFSRIERPWKLNMEGVTSNKTEINLTLTSSKICSLICR